MSPEHHLSWMTASVGGDGSRRKTNKRRGREEASSRCWQARRSVWGRSGQAGGWLGWRVAPRVPYGARPGLGPQALPAGSDREPGQRKVSLAGRHHPGVPPALTANTPSCLGSDNTFGWVAQARTPGLSSLLSILPQCPCLWSSLWPSSHRTLYSFIRLIGELLGRPRHRGWSSRRSVLPRGAFIHSPPISSR